MLGVNVFFNKFVTVKSKNMRTFFLLVFVMTLCTIHSQDIKRMNVYVQNSKYYNVILQNHDIKSIRADVKTDTLLQMERLAAFLFHKILNQYRISINKKQFLWNDSLWLASRNHCVYLAINSLEITHDQDSSLSYYTGFNIWDRYNYVVKAKKTYTSGENVLVIPFMKNYTIEELVKTSLDMWCSSLSHRENMSDGRFFSQGTAFYFDAKRNKMYAASMFMKVKTRYPSIAITWSESLRRKYQNFKHKPAN